ncbi:MAG: SRPBCC family protein [Actinomycetota bacterium]|nr:SRPBCC family protein [Actinomycetota bacterium]
MTETLIVTATVDAPSSAVFEVLADPANHAAIDGTGWLRDALDSGPLTAAGQLFRIAMYHDNHPDGHYEMVNKVIAFEPGRVIAWEPGQADADGQLEFGGWTWRYDVEDLGDLEDLGDGQTRVVLTYDWSAVPAVMREHIQFPPFPESHLHNSLANLAKLAVSRA